MSTFDPMSALFGGALIGLASALLMLLNGRIAGISGILGGALTTPAGDKIWRLCFIAGLAVAPIVLGSFGYALPEPQMPESWLLIIAAGALVGFGARNRFLVKAKLPKAAADPDVLAQLRRNVICETYLGVAVVVIVACLGLTPPARHQ